VFHFFTNHDNQNVENARGKVIHAEWNEAENSVYAISFVDREAFPHICRSIEEEYITGVSMGAISEGSMILMENGTQKPIEEIKSGDRVVSHNGNINEVKFVHEEFLAKDMYSFGLATYHKSPLFTEDHPILTVEKDMLVASKKESIKIAQNNKYSRGKGLTEEFIGQDTWRDNDYAPVFKEASKVTEGDSFLIPSKYRLKEGYGKQSDMFYLIGAYIGDGYLKKDKKGQFEAVAFCFNVNEIELAQKTISLLKEVTDNNIISTVIEERNGLYITVYDRDLANWFNEMIGTGSKNK